MGSSRHGAPRLGSGSLGEGGWAGSQGKREDRSSSQLMNASSEAPFGVFSFILPVLHLGFCLCLRLANTGRSGGSCNGPGCQGEAGESEDAEGQIRLRTAQDGRLGSLAVTSPKKKAG